jgi:hypothetical protein
MLYFIIIYLFSAVVLSTMATVACKRDSERGIPPSKKDIAIYAMYSLWPVVNTMLIMISIGMWAANYLDRKSG